MIFSEEDKKKVVERYSKRFADFGYSQKAVGWGEKGKQEFRFEVLASLWNFDNASVLDIGAGFGDLYKYLKSKWRIRKYQGLELVPALVQEGNKLFGQHADFNLSEANILDYPLDENYDFILISGLFNFKLVGGDNYEFINRVMAKAFSKCNVGLAANFITDRVDYHEELIFNAQPEKIISISLSLTKNFVLRNDYFPFEYSVFLNKDDSFSKSDTIFNSYKNAR